MARGRGDATEALRILTDYLFLHLDIGRIQCEVHPENTASRRLVERVGFTFEGILRRTHFRGGAWQDAAMYSLLREEWGGPRILPSGPPEGGIVVS